MSRKLRSVDHVPNEEDGNAGVVFGPFESQAVFNAVQSGLRDGIPVELKESENSH